MSGVHIKISDQGDYLPGTTERYEHLVFHFKKCLLLQILFNVSQAYEKIHECLNLDKAFEVSFFCLDSAK